MVLDRHSTDGIMALGGTIIGTTNRGHFVAKIGAGDRAVVAAEIIEAQRRFFEDLGVKALIIVGGDGSMTTALQLQEAGINCIGVPKTIDNDLEATAMTFGFDSAVAGVWTRSIDCTPPPQATNGDGGRSDGPSRRLDRALWRLAGGADIILIPEIPFDYDKIIEAMRRREMLGSVYSLVVCAEGACPAEGQPVMRRCEGEEDRYGGIGTVVAKEIAARTGKETRCTVLGYLQRGGAPTTLDRILGTRFGVKAVRLAAEIWHHGQLPKLSGAPRRPCRSRQQTKACPARRRTGANRARRRNLLRRLTCK